MRPTYYSGADVHRRSALMSDVEAPEKVWDEEIAKYIALCATIYSCSSFG